MSILFEAWRRARGEGEEVARALGAPPAVQASAGRLLPWILCVLLAALAAALGVYLWRLERTPRPAAARVAAPSGTLARPAAIVPQPQERATASVGKAASAAAPRRSAESAAGRRETAAHPAARAGAAAAAANGHGARESGAAHPVAAPATQAAPDAVRQALPPLPVTVHVWNPAPAARFVVVHGHMYHEGDEIAPGVRLVTITRAGEIVNFRGYEISLGGT